MNKLNDVLDAIMEKQATMMEQEILPSTSSEVKSDIQSFQRPCTVLEKYGVAEKIKSSESSMFARLLGLEESDIDEVELDCQIENSGIRETVFQLIVKWEQIKGSGATVEELIAALLKIGKTDIVQHLFPEYYHGKEQPLSDLLKQIQRKQEKKFSNLMLPRTLWMTKKFFPLEELYVELTMKKKDQLGREIQTKIAREELFEKMTVDKNTRDKDQRNIIPCRILVEGHPGYGKTTLVTKFLFDWSRGKRYMRDKFDLVFVIALRNFIGNLWNRLLPQIKDVDGSEEEKLREIKAIEGRVLLLLDGLDECNERVKESLVPLFNGDQHPNMTVLVTCRTGFIHFEHQPDDDFATMGTAGFGHHLVWDKRIQIKGISQERRLEFIQKYFNVEPSSLTLKFPRFDLEKNNLYECPLFLLLFAIFAQEGKLVSVTTKTELYRRIFNFVLSRNLNREKLLKEEIDVFDQNIEGYFTWRNLLIKFGRLCLKKMKEDSLIFEERELLECSGGDEIILQLGFVSKGLSFVDNEEEEYYEPIHRTFMEFLAAFYLSSLQEADFEKEVKELILELNILPGQSHLLYSFIGGFLQENAYKLFKVFCSYRCFTVLTESVDGIYDLGEILEEIPAINVNFLFLIPFFPADLNNLHLMLCPPVVKTFLSGVLNFIYRLKVTNNAIISIPENMEIIESFQGIVHINTVHVHIDDPKLEMNLFKSKIVCQKLIIMSTGREAMEFSITLEQILSKIEANKVFFSFKNTSPLEERTNFCDFYEVITRENLKNFKIHYLLVDIKSPHLFNSTHHLIEDLIGRRKIQSGLFLEFDVNTWNLDKINYFVDFVCKSHLTSFSLEYFGTDPFTFTADEKQWKHLSLKGNFKDTAIEDGHSLSVEHLDIRNLRLYNWNWLKNCIGLRRLQCDAQLIIVLNSSDFADWNGFETIEYLEIYETASEETEGLYDALQSVISRFRNLQEIKTPLYGLEEYLFKLISLAPSLTKICVYNFDPDVFVSAMKLIGSELTMNEQKVDIDLIVESTKFPANNRLAAEDEFQPVEIFKVLEQCCLKNISFTFSYSESACFLLYMWPDLFFKPKGAMWKYFLSRERFKVSSASEAVQYDPFGIPKIIRKEGISYEFPG